MITRGFAAMPASGTNTLSPLRADIENGPATRNLVVAHCTRLFHAAFAPRPDVSGRSRYRHRMRTLWPIVDNPYDA